MLVNLNDAIQLLNRGEVVAIPTETVYGLAARIDHDEAIQKIFQVKERPFFDPLIVHVSSFDQVSQLCKKFPPIFKILAEKFWPGPLTFIVPKRDEINPMITSGLSDIGIRMPNHPLTLQLIAKTSPLAAPSANKFKKTSPTKASHVEEAFASSVAVLDGGDCEGGIESTVIGIDGNTILIYRPGLITKTKIEEYVLHHGFQVEYRKSPVAPGQLEHHYMPKVPLFILFNMDSDALLPFKNPCELKLGLDPVLASRILYSEMRRLCDEGADALYFYQMPYHQTDEWRGIWDRLWKASIKS